MVEPVTAALAIGAAAKGIAGFFGAGNQKEIQAAITEAQVENFDAQIEEQRLGAARGATEIRAATAVSAGARGAQVSGSVQSVARQSISDNNLKALRSIRQLQFQKTLAELGAESRQDALTGQQIGAGIGFAGDLVAINQQAKDAGTLDELEKANQAGGGSGPASSPGGSIGIGTF